MRKGTRSDPLQSAPAGWLLARDWHAVQSFRCAQALAFRFAAT